MNAEIKAELLALGKVDVEPALLPRPSRSTAGPGTGLRSIFFKSGGHRVRMEIDPGSPLKMVEQNGDVVILKDNRELVRGKIDPVVAHCPEQTYITISEQCRYDCKFCSVPKFQGKIKTLEEVLAIVEKVKKRREFKDDCLHLGGRYYTGKRDRPGCGICEGSPALRCPDRCRGLPDKGFVTTAQRCRGDRSKIQCGDHGQGDL